MKKLSIQVFALIFISVLITCCRGIDGEGDVVIKDKSVNENFSGISLSVNADVFVNQSNEAKITVHGQQNIIDALDIEVDDKILKIGFKKNRVHDYTKLKFYISTAALESLNISGSGSIIANDSIYTGNMYLNISGSGNIKMYNLSAENNVKANISGSGNINLAGNTINTEFTISGSGNIQAFDLPAKNSNIKISGSGDVETTVSEKLDASISGSGNIKYKGRPVVNANTSGSGKIIHID